MKPDFLEQALGAERSRKGFSATQRDELWTALDRAIGLTTVPAPPEPPAKEPSPSTPQTPAPSAPVGVGASAAGGAAALKTVAILAVVALAGAGAGAFAHARWASPAVSPAASPAATPPMPSLPVAPAAATILPAPPSMSAPTVVTTVAIPPAVPNRAAVAPPSARPAATAPRDPALARERSLLDMARTAMSRGEAASALTTLETHSREFPSSQLREEREILAIQALASANRLPEARVRAAAFKATYPKSALAAVVEDAIH